VPCRYLVTSLSVVALVVMAPVAAIGQPSGWTVPSTPWGAPDLQGTYTNKTITPVQRPDELAGRDFLTEEEIATLEREAVERNECLLRTTAGSVDRGVDGAPGAYNNFWLDGGTRPTGRTSLIVDPPDGRIPPVTPAFDRVAAAQAEARLTPSVDRQGQIEQEETLAFGIGRVRDVRQGPDGYIYLAVERRGAPSQVVRLEPVAHR